MNPDSFLKNISIILYPERDWIEPDAVKYIKHK